MSDSGIRAYRPDDLPALKHVIDAVELFPSELLDGMVPVEGADAPGFWLTCDDGEPVAVAWCKPEPMTSGTWNLLLIAVRPDRHGKGIGTALMQHVETMLLDRDARVLLVDTSGTEAFERTRRFYEHIGYDKEACIRDYYDAGDDKVVYRKAL